MRLTVNTTATFILILFICPSFALYFKESINGGMKCAVCTAFVGVLKQIAQVQQKNPAQVLKELCNILPSSFDSAVCKGIISIFGPLIVDKLGRNETADVICYSMHFCHVDPGSQFCHLFPLPEEGMPFAVRKSQILTSSSPKPGTFFMDYNNIARKSICYWPGIRKICEEYKIVHEEHLPYQDDDKDKFSMIESLRGSSWRGRDCNDANANIYPGRKPINGDLMEDSNCNGISGTNPVTGKSYEEELCPNNTYGIIYIGDSIGAHFHIPLQWVTAKDFDIPLFKNLSFVIGNEFDWPQAAFSTGYMQLDWPIQSGPTDSLYLRLREHDLCSHRDYQNICFNGAGVNDILKYQSTVARNKETDNPAIVFYSIMGNDVCLSYMNSTDDFMSSKEFRSKVVLSLQKLDAVLPMGSHLILIGLLDAGFVYPTYHNRLHPFGQLNNDVTYSDFYEWMECMHFSLCSGWFSKNVTYREATTKKAKEFSSILQDISRTEKFKSFDVNYIENPFFKVKEQWIRDGHELWEVLDPVDTVHPVQELQPYVAKQIWEDVVTQFPHIIGKPNKNNEEISKLFGNQGGH